MNKSKSLVPVICGISYVYAEDADLCIHPDASINSIKVVLKTGKVWIPLYFTPGTAKFSQSLDTTDGLRIYSQRLELDFPGLIESYKLAEDFRNKLFLIKMDYNDGNSYILGCLNNPAQFINNYDDQNGGSIFIFSCDAYYIARLLSL
jgi:hypothetical protein